MLYSDRPLNFPGERRVISKIWSALFPKSTPKNPRTMFWTPKNLHLGVVSGRYSSFLVFFRWDFLTLGLNFVHIDKNFLLRTVFTSAPYFWSYGRFPKILGAILHRPRWTPTSSNSKKPTGIFQKKTKNHFHSRWYDLFLSRTMSTPSLWKFWGFLGP